MLIKHGDLKPLTVVDLPELDKNNTKQVIDEMKTKLKEKEDKQNNDKE